MKLLPLISAIPLLFSSAAWSQTDAEIKIAELVEKVKNAEPIERVAPRYPEKALSKGQEGWVQVSFVVDKEGNVVDPIVEDSSGVRAFEKAALKAMKQWRYEPATRNDETIEQCHTRVQMDFVLDWNNRAGVRRTFYTYFNKVAELIDQGKMDEAVSVFAELESKSIHNRYENAYFWALDSDLAVRLDDLERAIESAGRAIYSSDQAEYLGESNLQRMIFRKFRGEVQLEWFSEALETYQNLLEHHSETLPELVVELKPYAEQIEELFTSDTHLTRRVELADSSSWAYTLVRNRFALTDLQGEFDTLDVRCQNHRAKYTVEADNIWTIPESWGTCRVHINATPNSQFQFVELANTAI